MAIQITRHLREQAERKGMALAAIEAILKAPAITYKSFSRNANGTREARVCEHHNVQQEKWTGEAFGQKICICVYPCCGKAVTAWFDQIETEIRPDQRAAGLTGFIGRDGRMRR